jgi:phenylacetate-CoA ligase
MSNRLQLLLDAWKTKRLGKHAIEERQQSRLADIVNIARQNSPYYKELYKGLPDNIKDVSVLPITSKKKLMERFDDWCTDRNIKLSEVQELVKDPNLIGKKFLGKYTVATTSGTTGTPGIFLLDSHSMMVTSVLAIRMLSSWLAFGDVLKIIVGRGRMAMVMATGGHFASSIAAARMTKSRGKNFIALSAHKPMPELVASLNKFKPALLAPYASMGALLATEQEEGRLNIRPVLITLSAEGLAESEYKRIAKVFDSKVGNSYAATECPFFSYSCKEGWLHVNSDWVIAEPVDVNYKRVSAGVQSHTVLVTNLANRIQPILRYDLGDGIILRPEPCPCGNKLPAIKVTGRSSDVVSFFDEKGQSVAIPPLAFSILVDHIQGIERIQIVQTSPTILKVRLRYDNTSNVIRISFGKKSKAQLNTF